MFSKQIRKSLNGIWENLVSKRVMNFTMLYKSSVYINIIHFIYSF